MSVLWWLPETNRAERKEEAWNSAHYPRRFSAAEGKAKLKAGIKG
jgi:hypothetical protein